MKKRTMLGATALAAVGLIAAFATNAYAFPTRTTSCAACHSGAALTVNASETSNDGTTASYAVSAPGADAIAVFASGVKVDRISGASGSISVPVGATYELQAVRGPSNTDGWGSLVVSPAATAPVMDPTPVTTPAVDPTPTATPAPHPAPVTTPTVDASGTVRIHVMARTGRGIAASTVTVTNVSTGIVTTATADPHGRVTFKSVPYGRYTVTVVLSNGTALTRTFTVGHRRTTIQLKDHRTHERGHDRSESGAEESERSHGSSRSHTVTSTRGARH